ncbi:alpha/beta fold hydrolase [Pseudosulfitobacter pseudonitzschiae]|uniref:alpha/beta fold hydrolase n=1 Tax=Pseudosulfitobacter pseudonitzschiae TaxID=1402135 RepID=UPI001AF9AEFB|nr:alpha/beta hydrolase [Pseudosulfitobacter pseudonitzschiae]MBM1817312.1 alpha/beta hydrolase [Pseudosulfitobacter pseudonitzschiae]MBM1834323.1 alpha/beta hydrolase [Pseudosulfitobacter pseudonitzschiae]MBM1839188.1 alpha/beta hydrolase [Pseudosulfitobacter pseudonitzschiae]MBM1844037.1 alpha/beta hydrolase [Pseudosulfitobacter pseudonitzschiae]MBM1848873.1 alpha/beta hydrolase [Pseudosulfitobacter pseudonitzschiae]
MAFGYNTHANGIRQHLIRYDGPKGAPQLLVIPGITSPAVTWGFVAERLADRFEVHVLDVRGRGLSETGDLDYTLDALADDAIALARQMGNPIVMGHSMGARIAIRANARDPEAFAGFLLVDPPMSGPMRRAYPSKWPWYGDSIVMAAKGCSVEDMRAYCPTWSEEQLALRAEWLHTCHWGAIRIAFDGFHTDDIHQDLPKIAKPARLVIAGGATVVDAEDQAEVAQLNPAIEQVIVPGAGHMIPWDDLEGFLGAVLDFTA